MSRDEARVPTLEDLLALCAELNRRGARYVVVGGMAMIRLGFTRATEDIDLLVESGAENERRVIDALATLPDHAAAELKPGEIERYEVIRVADEVVVDLMSRACGVSFREAEPLIEQAEVQGVSIPFASAELMGRLKQGDRLKDKLDLEFLSRLAPRKGKRDRA